MVVLDHGSGFYTVYGHGASLSVQAGQRVIQGQALGEIGAAGADEGSSLYFEVRQNGKPMNPLHWLSH